MVPRCGTDNRQGPYVENTVLLLLMTARFCSAHHSNSADGEITDNVLASRWISSPQQSANQYNDDSSRSISPNCVKNSKSPTCSPRPEYEYPWSTELEAKHKASEKEQSRPSTPLPGDMPPYFELKSPMNEQCKEKFQFAPRKKCGLDEADSGRGVKTDPDTGSTETAGAAGSKITADSASSVPNAVGKNGLAQSDQNPSNREGVSVPHTCTTTEKPAVTDDPTDMKRDTTQKDFILLSERAIGSSSPSTGASRERSVPRRPWDMPKLNIEAALGTATPGTSDGNGKNLSVLMPEERGVRNWFAIFPEILLPLAFVAIIVGLHEKRDFDDFDGTRRFRSFEVFTDNRTTVSLLVVILRSKYFADKRVLPISEIVFDGTSATREHPFPP